MIKKWSVLIVYQKGKKLLQEKLKLLILQVQCDISELWINEISHVVDLFKFINDMLYFGESRRYS